MLFTLRIFFFCLVAPPTLVAVLIYSATDIKPDVNIRWSLTQQDIKRAKTIINDHVGNRNNAITSLRINEKDLNIVANHLLNRYARSATQIGFLEKQLVVNTSITIPNNLLNPYLNIRFHLSQQGDFPTIKNLSFGQINIPDEYAIWLLDQIIKYSQLNQYALLTSPNLKNIVINSNNLELNYFSSETRKRNYERQSQPGITTDDAIIFYQHRLAEIVKNHDRGWLLSLADLLQPLFKDAQQRSKQLDPIKENRAIIFVVNAYVNKQKIQALMPKLSDSTVAEYLPVFIYKRIDLAQHFMISAALTAFANAQITHLIGQEKEFHDAKHGSGFSFVDLAADRAGVQFGKTATQSKQKALRFQKNMAAIQNYQAFMPNIEQLPENISRQEFTKRYSSFYSKAYKDQLQTIDSRISTCKIYQNL